MLLGHFLRSFAAQYGTDVPRLSADAIVVHGPPEYCRERVQEYVDNGVTTPVMALLPVGVPAAEAIKMLGRA